MKQQLVGMLLLCIGLATTGCNCNGNTPPVTITTQSVEVQAVGIQKSTQPRP